ncbi:unnamed protein product, partial [Mesorhabditis belari]|uniref:Uncharacterized protein n=1 Tax=Mesorhabditis belari TaxID=2138241 RepID=A0AAF3EM35_9BILA
MRDLYDEMEDFKTRNRIRQWTDGRMEIVTAFIQPSNTDKPKTLSWSPTDETEGVSDLIGMPALWIALEGESGPYSNNNPCRVIMNFSSLLIDQRSKLSIFYYRHPRMSFQTYRVKLIITTNVEQRLVFERLSNHFLQLDLYNNPFLCLMPSGCWTNFFVRKFKYSINVAFLEDLQPPGFAWDLREIVLNESARQRLRDALLKQWAYHLRFLLERFPHPDSTLDLRHWLNASYDWRREANDHSVLMARTKTAHRVTKNWVTHWGSAPPAISRLKWQVVYCKLHDGPLTGCPGLFFSTTLFRKGLGDISPYPLGGIPVAYHRVTIPLHYFESCQLWYQKNPIARPKANRTTNNSSFQYQVLIVVTEGNDGQYFRDLGELYEPLDVNEPNPFLYRKDGQWWANNLTSLHIDGIEIRYTVNLVLLRDWKWTDGCEWRGASMKMPAPHSMNIDDCLERRNDLALTILRQWAAYFEEMKRFGEDGEETARSRANFK